MAQAVMGEWAGPSLGHCITMALPVPGALAALTLWGHRRPEAASDLIPP